MSYKLHTSILALLFITFCAFTTEGSKQGKRKIDNKLYTITLPSDWEPSPGSKGDGTIPGERDGGPFHLHYFQWQARYDKTFESTIDVFIQSYQRLDGTPLSVKDIEDLETNSDLRHPAIKNVKKTIQNAKPGQRRYMITKESQNLQGRYEKIREFVLIQKSQGMVHYLTLSLQEGYYSKPDVQKMIKEILDSYVVKK